MASHFAILSLLILLFISIPFISTQGSFHENPDINTCGGSMVSLIPCAPFVQGSSPSPVQPCCDGILDVYNQEPDCLCILFNNTTITDFPINRTLALQLPDLCGLSPNTSACPGLASPPAPSSSQSPITEGTNPNTIVTGAPMAEPEPVPIPVPVPEGGFKSPSDASVSVKLKINGKILFATIALLLLENFSRF